MMTERRIALAEAIEMFLAWKSKTLGESSMEVQRRGFRGFSKFAQGKMLDVVDSGDWLFQMTALLENWQADMKGRLAPITASRSWSIVSSLFRWCVRHGYITINPFSMIPAPRVPRQERTIITDDEYQRLLSTTAGTPYNWAITLGYHTGMSLVDVCRLMWSDVDKEQMIIRRVRHKMKFRNPIPCLIPYFFGDPVYTGLEALAATSEGSKWVHSRLAEDHIYNRTALFKRMKRRFQKAGIPDKTFHNLRHTFISRLANTQDANVVLLGKISGHANPKIFGHYVHPDIGALREAMRKAMTPATPPPNMINLDSASENIG